mgnify:CR=1 FL=1
MKHLAALALLALASVGCAPTLRGSWEASGHLGVADPFDLDLKFDQDNKGFAIYGTDKGTERQVPVCETSLVEGRVKFVIDAGGKTTCATLEKPLTFTGALGQDVMTGDIQNAPGEKVGIWRAYRRVQK